MIILCNPKRNLLIIIFRSDIKYKTIWIDQNVDHFSYKDDRTYKQRYLENSDFKKDAKSPIFFYTGNEGPIDSFAANTGNDLKLI